MLDKEKVVSNLKYADMVEDKAKGFSAEADRIKKMYWTLREIRSTAVPDLPWEYVEEMAAWTNSTLAALAEKGKTLRDYVNAIRYYSHANSEDENDRTWAELTMYFGKPLEEFDRAEMDKLLEEAQTLLETNGLEAPLLTAWP